MFSALIKRLILFPILLFQILWAQNSDLQLKENIENTPGSEPQISNQNEAPKLECSLRISLKERGTRNPIKGGSIFRLPEGLRAITDENAFAEFTNLPCQQEISFVINVTGYKRYDFKQTLIANKIVTQTFYLDALTDNVYRTVVTADKNKRDGSKRTIEQEDFIGAVGARGDPIIALENEPGFGNFSDGGGVILQGADPEDTRFYVNGHEIPLIFHSLGFSSIFIPEFIQSVDLLTAGFGSEFGRTVGGNINLNTRDPKNDRLHALAYVDLLNAAALIEGPLDEAKNHSFLIGSRVSYIGPVFNLVSGSDDNVTFNQVPQFFDVQGSYTWKIQKGLTFDILGFAAKDAVKINIKDNEDPQLRGNLAFQTRFFRIIPRIRYEYGKQNRFEFSMAHGIDDLDQKFDEFFFDAVLYKPTYRSDWEHHWSKNFVSIVGLDTQFTYFKADLSVPSGTFPNSENDNIPAALQDLITTQINEKYWDWGAYTRFNILTDDEKWLFSPNFRFDHSDLTNESHISPRLEITRTLSQAWKLRAASGIYFQTPQAPEIEKTFGNPDLNDLRSHHYALTAFFDAKNADKNGFSGDITGFYRDIDNVVVGSSEFVSRGGEIVPLRYSNNGQGRAYGSQMSMQWKGRRLKGGLSYTLLWSERKEPGRGFFATEGDQRHNFNIRSSYKLGNWELSSRFRFISGRRTTPVLDAYYDIDNDLFIPVEGVENSDSVPNFVQLDLRADRKWIFEKWIMSLYVDIQNVTNRANGFDYDYAFDYSSRDVQAGIPVLPTFGIKGEF